MEPASVSDYAHLAVLHSLADPDAFEIQEPRPFCFFCKAAAARALGFLGRRISLGGALPEQARDDLSDGADGESCVVIASEDGGDFFLSIFGLSCWTAKTSFCSACLHFGLLVCYGALVGGLLPCFSSSMRFFCMVVCSARKPAETHTGGIADPLGPECLP